MVQAPVWVTTFCEGILITCPATPMSPYCRTRAWRGSLFRLIGISPFQKKVHLLHEWTFLCRQTNRPYHVVLTGTPFSVRKSLISLMV